MDPEDEYDVESDLSDSDNGSDYDSDYDSDDGSMDDSMDDAVILSVNLTFPIPGPYATPWFYSDRSPWSQHLVQHGEFTITDAALLAFTVDVAMKIYIVDDINFPVSDIANESSLVWVILERVAQSMYARIRSYGWAKRRVVATVEHFYIDVTRDLFKMRERYTIAFLQCIQDPQVKTSIATEIVVHNSFADCNRAVRLVFRWVYGEWPESVLQKKTAGSKQESSSRPTMTIRQWVFHQN
ncbi:hypothetical protein ACJQWK_03309 [Exserohilum turcicum]|uniref:Uncharacterized protein n=1 Tax=Exserohilum turcicum (strain 28A) TaxID=671987 RepID=R0KTQ1_EXST2|nr:uncharacterized protein SETTUDRAFT_162731 [Exserohilum turcica Et28A]EOA92304.1 hypothetical protein SETTUDRAFT_162731 [Exserohilum turcica Et28A]